MKLGNETARKRPDVAQVPNLCGTGLGQERGKEGTSIGKKCDLSITSPPYATAHDLVSFSLRSLLRVVLM